MDANWADRFEEFGEDCYLPYPRSKLERITVPAAHSKSSRSHADRIAFLKQSVAKLAPKLPGVYGMIDEVGRLVYVGKSKALRNRLLSYFLPNNEEDKSGRIAQTAHQIVWERQPSEFAALLREQHLIRLWLPRMNVVGIPKRRQLAFLCLGKPPGEYFYLSRHFDATAKCSVGPISGVSHLNRAIEILTRHFRLRDCSQKVRMQFSNQLTLFDLDSRPGCVRYELGNCSAPCLPGSDRLQYAHQVDSASLFMRTGESTLPVLLQASMERAAAGLHFENAARIREDLKTIKWLSRKLASFQNARDTKPMVYSTLSQDDRPIWYLLTHGGIAGAVPRPRNGNDWRKFQSLLKNWSQGNRVVGAPMLNPDDTLGLVTTWLQKEKKGAQSRMISTDENPGTEQPWLERLDALPTSWLEMQHWLQSRMIASQVA